MIHKRSHPSTKGSRLALTCWPFFCLTDYTDGTDYACLAASGISLLIPQKAKAKYRKKQKQNTAKN